MTDRERQDSIIDEETRLLEKVRAWLLTSVRNGVTFSGYDDELIELRDAIGEALPEDVPSLVEQMTRLQSLAAQRGQGEELPVDPDSPYFGHMRLDEGGQSKDVFLGKRTHLAPAAGISIVDWRNAPVSRIYYSYEEGDDYEERFGGKVRSGVLVARRSVTITGGVLRRVDCPLGSLVRRDSGWVRLDDAGAKLRGGQGTSVRAAATGRLGEAGDGVFRADKHLPEISGLLDRTQFALISDDDSDVLIVQGSAGSGKTTVGLHRIAYLAYGEGRRLKPGRMMVIVLNRALANYISDVLPSLGVSGVKVRTFEEWAQRLRRRHVPGLPGDYSEWTPSVVSRAKKHPAMLRILADHVDLLDEQLTGQLRDGLAALPDGDRIVQTWQAMARIPLDARRSRLVRWLDGEIRIGGGTGEHLERRTVIAAHSILSRMAPLTADVIQDWAELMTDRARLRQVFDIHAPAEFSDGDIDTIHDWCTRAWTRIVEFMDAEKEKADEEAFSRGEEGEDDGDEAPGEIEACLDREDDAMLLRLYQLKRGWLQDGDRRIEYDHLMVDEVQDFSALEVRVLLEVVGPGRPVTLAGDTAQKIVREGGFDDWDTFLDDLGVLDARVESLKIAYRSTVEVMAAAREVLGPLAGDESVATRHGAPVEVHQFSDPGQAVDFLGGALRDLASREPLANVAIIARHASQATLYYQGLKKAEIPRLSLVVEQDFSFRPGVEVTEVRQVKGLEFDYVVLVECNEDSYPLNDEARHLLHVGMTRAAHQLWLVTTGRPSPLIPASLL